MTRTCTFILRSLNFGLLNCARSPSHNSVDHSRFGRPMIIYVLLLTARVLITRVSARAALLTRDMSRDPSRDLSRDPTRTCHVGLGCSRQF